MKAEIICFSATKTTEEIAKAFTEGLACGVIFTDITAPKNRARYTPAESDLVVIATPVYGQRIPRFVLKFIDQIDGGGRPLVAICVYGNVGYGVSLREFAHYAKKHNFKLVAAGAFVGEHTYAFQEGMPGYGRPNADDSKQAHAFGRKTREKIDAGNLTPPAVKKGLLPFLAMLMPDSVIRLLVRQPAVDFNACTRCELCAKACPFGAIDPKTLLINEKSCNRCCACVKICPENARPAKFRLSFFGSLFGLLGGKPKQNRIFL